MVSAALFLDLKRAFDSVKHQLLLLKLKAGLAESSVNWFRSYLEVRYQVTRDGRVDQFEDCSNALRHVQCCIILLDPQSLQLIVL